MRLLGLSVFALVAAAAPAPTTVRPEEVVNHLETSIAWFRHVNSLEQTPSASVNTLLRERTRDSALQALRLAFTFARAENALLALNRPPTQNQANPQGTGQNLQQALSRAADRVNGLESRITSLDQQIPKAPAKERPTLAAQRSELAAELDLAKEIQGAIVNLVNFSGNAGAAAGGLAAQINELEGSVPEVRSSSQSGLKPPASPSSQAAANAAAFQPETAGIVTLTGDLISVHSTEMQYNDVLKETNALIAEINQTRNPLLGEVRQSVQRSDQLASSAASQDPQELAAAQKEVTALAARFKQLSSAIVPLGEEAIAVASVRADVQEAINSLDHDLAMAGRYLLLRAGILGFVIFLILGISGLWRRATFRYVSDSRRRRQFLMLRRIVVTCAIIIALTFGFVTEFGSLATYAGLITAGLAVALQNVILSVVAYFFLIGRYGIRVGDRVTISGVTGDVLDIGLVRIYLMELAGTGGDLHSTGRVVVFANSVIFQPAALYKQIPGINYVWHTVAVTLGPESDLEIAEKKLNAAVDSVYQEYRSEIERQHSALAQSVDVQVSIPHPQSHMRFTENGLEFSVRYPANLKEAAIIDDRVMKALHEAIASEPKLKLASAGEPRVLQTV